MFVLLAGYGLQRRRARLGRNDPRHDRALYSQHFDSHAQPPNTARFVFFDDRSTSFYSDWNTVAADIVAILRAEAGRDPYDRELSDLVGELSTRSELFRTLWAAHDVHAHDSGVKNMHHPLVGEIKLSFEAMELVADPGLTMWVYTAEPGSRSQQIKSHDLDTGAGPGDRFSGDVYIDAEQLFAAEFDITIADLRRGSARGSPAASG
jgi:hypothetical protein